MVVFKLNDTKAHERGRGNGRFALVYIVEVSPKCHHAKERHKQDVNHELFFILLGRIKEYP